MPSTHSITFSTNVFEGINIWKELLAIKRDSTFYANIDWARKAKNLGFPVFPGKMNWEEDSFKGVGLYGAFKGEVRRSNGRVISAYYDSENDSLGFSLRVLLEYAYPDNETWIPSSFNWKGASLDDNGVPLEDSTDITHIFEFEKFEILEEPFPDSDFAPVTYYVGDTNRLRYEFISGNVTNYFSMEDDKRARRAEAWRRKIIRNRIFFSSALVVMGVLMYLSVYGLRNPLRPRGECP